MGASLLSSSPVAAATAPSTISATSTRGSGVITVEWSAISGTTAYQAYIFIGSVRIKTSPSISSSATRSYTFVGLEYNVPYNVKVRSYDGSNWSSFGEAAENPVTPLAAAPSAPAQPTLSVLDDMKLKASWSPPSSNGGSPIASYSVQLLKGSEAIGQPVKTTGLEVELETKDKTNSYSVTVTAINEADVKSDASEASAPMVAEKQAAAIIEVSQPSNNTPSSGGNNSPSSGGNISPSSGGNISPSSGGGNNTSAGNTNTGLTNSPAAAPAINQLTQVVSPSPVIPAYTKVIKAKSTTTSKTLVSLSKLATPKGSKTSFTVATSSKKYCQLKGTSVKNLKAGTCSVKVTVTTKTGKKSSRTVKLIAR